MTDINNLIHRIMRAEGPLGFTVVDLTYPVVGPLAGGMQCNLSAHEDRYLRGKARIGATNTSNGVLITLGGEDQPVAQLIDGIKYAAKRESVALWTQPERASMEAYWRVARDNQFRRQPEWGAWLYVPSQPANAVPRFTQRDIAHAIGFATPFSAVTRATPAGWDFTSCSYGAHAHSALRINVAQRPLFRFGGWNDSGTIAVDAERGVVEAHTAPDARASQGLVLRLGAEHLADVYGLCFRESAPR